MATQFAENRLRNRMGQVRGYYLRNNHGVTPLYHAKVHKFESDGQRKEYGILRVGEPNLDQNEEGTISTVQFDIDFIFSFIEIKLPNMKNQMYSRELLLNRVC